MFCPSIGAAVGVVRGAAEPVRLTSRGRACFARADRRGPACRALRAVGVRVALVGTTWSGNTAGAFREGRETPPGFPQGPKNHNDQVTASQTLPVGQPSLRVTVSRCGMIVRGGQSCQSRSAP